MKGILRSLITLALAAMSMYTGISAAQQADRDLVRDNSVKLPSESYELQSKMMVINTETNTSWKNFTKGHGNWTVMMDKLTNTPHRAFGQPVRIEGYNTITNDNIAPAAMSFIKQNASVLGVDPANLKPVRMTEKNGRWYVSYRQVYKGLDVLLSEIELRIFSNGNVMAFGADYYKDINLSVNPAISMNEAVRKASGGMDVKSAKNSILSEGRLYVLPVRLGNSIEYRLVYKVRVDASYPDGIYESYVDAHEGDVVWRRPVSYNAATHVTVKGLVKPAKANDPDAERLMPFQYITIGDSTYTTDENGSLGIDLTEKQYIGISFTGPWSDVNLEDDDNASISDTIKPGEDMGIMWNDDNSTDVERTLFYHAGYVHDFVKKIDPDLSCMDFPMEISVQLGGDPNAYSEGKSITFTGAGSEEMRMAKDPGVLYHEYGHSVNSLLYMALDSSNKNGMINATCQEGTADLLAALITDAPYIGLGVFAEDSNKSIRRLKNDMVYPDSLQMDSHLSGQILSGAYWDLREMTSLDYARNISHLAKYGMPDDVDDGIAFSEWFIETLVADDDDGDLSNGTPHSVQIIRAFNRHGIGSNLLMKMSFSHTPLEDSQDTLNPYSVEFEYKGASEIGGKADSVSVWYSTDNYQTTHRVFAESDGGVNYTAFIPAQEKGTILNYYVSAWDKFSQTDVKLNDCDFLVGYSQAYYNEFEDKGDWGVVNSENYYSGAWDVGEPEKIDFSLMGAGIIQPGKDHSEKGTKCFVTDYEGDAMSSFMHMVIGETSLISPVMDISKLEKPILKFYKWFSAVSVMGGFSDAALIVDFSSDGGETWINADTLKSSTDGWEKSQFILDNYVSRTHDFRLRITAKNIMEDMNQQQMPLLCEALVDDLELLSANKEIISSVDNENMVINVPELISYPNPFSNSTTIRFNSKNSGRIKLKIYNLSGFPVKTLIDGYYEAGESSLRWNGCDDSGTRLPAGIYFIRLQAGKEIYTEKLNLY